MKDVLGSVLSAVAGWMLWFLTYLLSSTVRWTFIGRELFKDTMSRTALVAVFWHGEFLVLPYLHRNSKIAIIISRSRDGDIATAVIKRYGFAVIRGSSTRGAESAARETVEYIQNHYTIGLTGDGPKGPYHELKPGPVWFAQKMGVPVVPVTVRFRHCIRIKSWDRFFIPLPFTRGVFIYGDPVSMQGIQRREGMRIIKQRMDEQGARADRIFSKTTPKTNGPVHG